MRTWSFVIIITGLAFGALLVRPGREKRLFPCERSTPSKQRFLVEPQRGTHARNNQRFLWLLPAGLAKQLQPL